MTLMIDSLTCGYRPDVPVVRRLSLSVEQGTAVGVVGRNGAGKTCAAGAVMGLRPVLGGRVLLDGTDLTGRTARGHIDGGLALVPEGRMIFAQLTVHENLVAAAYGAGSALSASTVEMVHDRFPVLAAKSDLPAAALSGGEQQFLAVARALVQGPRAIVLDEPTLGLSPVAVEMLGETLIGIRDDGVALLLMEQNPDLLAALCTQIHVMDRGEVTGTHDVSMLRNDDDVARVLLGDS
jgi:branched-chain amino acid transport system ATP-binding protein